MPDFLYLTSEDGAEFGRYGFAFGIKPRNSTSHRTAEMASAGVVRQKKKESEKRGFVEENRGLWDRDSDGLRK